MDVNKNGWRRRFTRPPLAITLVVCALVLAARRPDAIRTPQFWAEDSVVFYAHAYVAGVHAFWAQYAGYLHALPRLIAAAAMHAEPERAPAVFVAAAFAL